MITPFWQRVAAHPLIQGSVRLVKETPIEIAIGALLVATGTGVVRYNILDAKTRLPVAFSEIERATRKFENNGQQVPPLTRYYSVINDVPMKVFEAENLSKKFSDGNNKAFARELEIKTDRALRIHAQIGEYAATMPADANAALKSMDGLVAARKFLPAINRELEQSWSYYPDHHYEEETEYYQDCDDEGDCETKTRPVEVYHCTTHYYTYDRAHGERAAQMLDSFLKAYPDMTVAEALHLVTETGADNEYAIETSMRELLKGRIPTQEQALKFANTWATSNNLTKYGPRIIAQHKELTGLAANWNTAKNSARSTSYRTFSRYDDGPSEYRLVEQMQRIGQSEASNAGRVVDGVIYAKNNIPLLNQKIKEYIAVVLDNKKGDADDLRDEIMDISRTAYLKNFENGLDVNPFKWGDLILFIMLGGAVGAGIGAGVNFGINQIRKRPDNPYQSPI